jgi:hypothetical protein
LEMDCTTMIAALRSSSLDRSLQWDTNDEAKKLLWNVGDHRLSHTNRESNRVADALAKMARSVGSCIWLSQFPDIISDLVTQDQTRLLQI